MEESVRVSEMNTWYESQNNEISDLANKLSRCRGNLAAANSRLRRGAEKGFLTRIIVAAFMPHKWGKK